MCSGAGKLAGRVASESWFVPLIHVPIARKGQRWTIIISIARAQSIGTGMLPLSLYLVAFSSISRLDERSSMNVIRFTIFYNSCH